MKRGLSLALVLLLVLTLTACGGGGVRAKDGYGEGKQGDVMHTHFFDYTVNSAYLADTYESHTPAEGYQVLVINVTVANTTKNSIEMYDTDFWVEWTSTSDDNYTWAITSDDEGNEIPTVSDEQLPYIYRLASKEERTGTLVFDVPSGYSDFSLWSVELFDDGTDEGQLGDYFAVYFTPEG